MARSADGARLSSAQRATSLGAKMDLLLAAGKTIELCALVAARFARRTDAGDLAEVAALVSALPDEVLARHPQVLLELARACDAETRVRLRTRLLARAEGLPIADGLIDSFVSALEAERIADLARDGCADEVETRTASLRTQLDTAEDSTLVREARVRSSYALGRVRAWRGDPISIAAAEDALQTAAGGARELRRDEWRAQALHTLGYSVHFYRGEELRAVSRLREAADLLPVGHPRRAGMLTYLADVYVRSHTGDPAVSILNEVRDEAATTGDQRSLGYAAWVMAVLSAERNERAATLEWLAEAERHPGDWFEHPIGIEFLTEAAVSAERVGETALADRYLERATTRAVAAGHPEAAWFSTGMINARRGSPEVAIDALSRLLEQPWLPPRDQWSIWLHLALARLRAGDEAGAAQDAVRAFEATSALVGPGRAAPTRAELPEVVTRLEPDPARRLAPIAAAAGSALAAQLQPVTPRIRLFGGLAVQVGATSAIPPAGRPALLLMLVAVTNRPVPIDMAIEELWPGSPREVGRRRMRNVLARIRTSCGDLLIRNGDTITLAAGIVVDVAEFEQACDRVDRALPGDKPALARAALGLYGRELLPEAAYAPRVLRVADELGARAVQLLEIVATDAVRSGRIDDAVTALADVAEIDPYDAETPARIAQLLRDSGRREQAARWQNRARLVQED